MKLETKKRANIKLDSSNLCSFVQKRQLALLKNTKATQAAPQRLQNLRVQYWQQVKEIEPSNLYGYLTVAK